MTLPISAVSRFRSRSSLNFALPLALAFVIAGHTSLSATITAISISSPMLVSGQSAAVTSPIHFGATAESDLTVTGYVVYVDGHNVHQNHSPSLNAWVLLPPGGTHSLYIKAWDSSGSSFSTATYSIKLTGAAPPSPPVGANRLNGIDKPELFSWEVDNNPGVGGQCNDGSLGAFVHGSDPNTANSPDFDDYGQHFIVTSKCTYDDSLFMWKDSQNPQPASTNYLWDFWVYMPTTTKSTTVQALEFDLFHAVQLGNNVREFMFGSQCNYAINQWQFWLPSQGQLRWVSSGLSPCQFSSGRWHHLTYFLQRVTSNGYQQTPASFNPSSDPNSYLRFGTLTVDGKTMYLGGLSYSTIPSPAWNQVLGIQHQLDSAASGITIEEYDDEESLTSW